MKYFLAESIMTSPLPVSPEDMKSKFIPAHESHLADGIRQGLLLLGGPNEKGGGFLILRAENRGVLDDFLERDPFRINGINRFQITEFDPRDHVAAIDYWYQK